MVCADRELSKLDVGLSQAYAKARDKTADKNKLKKEQLEWIKFSLRACSDKACLISSYSKRITQLQSETSPMVKTNSTPLPNLCKDDDQKGGEKKIYTDVNLRKISDLTSGGSMFTPSKVVELNGKKVYEGTLENITNGRDVPGIFFVDAKEWDGLCK